MRAILIWQGRIEFRAVQLCRTNNDGSNNRCLVRLNLRQTVHVEHMDRTYLDLIPVASRRPFDPQIALFYDIAAQSFAGERARIRSHSSRSECHSDDKKK